MSPKTGLDDLLKNASPEDVRKAIEDGSVRVPDQSIHVRDISEVFKRVAESGRRHFLTQRTIVSGSHGVVGAMFKGGKTWDVTDLAVSVATGTAWLGLFDVREPGLVLMYLGEGSEHEFARRILAVCDSKGVEPRDLSGRIRMATRVPRFTDADHMRRVVSELESYPAALAIVDPVYIALKGAQQGSLMDVGDRLEPIRIATQDAGASLVLVWHWNQTGTGNGAARFTGAGAAEWGRFLGSAALESKRREDDGTVLIQKSYQWTGSEIPDLGFKVTTRIKADDPEDINSQLHYEVVAEETKETTDLGLTYGDKRVMEALAGETEPRTISQIQDEMAQREPGKRPYRADTLSTYLNDLAKRGFVDSAEVDPVSHKKGWWRLR